MNVYNRKMALLYFPENNKETEIYYMNSYVMNKIYNDWYNSTLNWVQLYEDSMYNNIKKLDKYITNG